MLMTLRTAPVVRILVVVVCGTRVVCVRRKMILLASRAHADRYRNMVRGNKIHNITTRILDRSIQQKEKIGRKHAMC